jgi:hypothetical protein
MGHDFSFCPCRATDVSDSERVPFVTMLMDMPKFDISIYVGMSTAEAKSFVTRRGATLNATNPWRKSGRIRDKLRKNLAYWYYIGSPRNVITWLAYGLKMRPIFEPRHLEFKNHPSYYRHTDFLEADVAKQVRLGRFAVIQRKRVKMCHPLHVDESLKSDGSTKLRICNDLRMLNGHLAHMRFKMETAEQTIPVIVEPSDWLASADAEEAYYCVWMHKSAWPYQCFKHGDAHWRCDSEGVRLSLLLSGRASDGGRCWCRPA